MHLPALAAARADGPDHAAVLQRHLDRGYRSMRFEPALESDYREHRFRKSVRYLRVNLLLLIALVFLIVQNDRVAIPGFTDIVPTAIRLGVMVPILLIALALTFHRAAPIWYPRVMTGLMAVALMGIAWVGLLAWDHHEDRVFVRLIIATIALYFVVGLKFHLALAVNLFSIVFYVAAARSFGMPTVVLTQFLEVLLVTTVICAVAAYNLEHARRTAWLEGELLKTIAVRDTLTGIHSRRRLDEHLQQVWQQGLREGKPIALLFMDLDCFKAYNDHYGLQAGDAALKAVASVYSRYGRRPFDLAARFGGEEFAIVLFDTGQQAALKIGERIIAEVQALQIAHAHSTAAPVLTVSIGIACTVPTTQRDSAGLLQGADQALYAAKHSGRNRARLLDAAS